ncbi:MAG: GspE/PulE family protein [Thermodesulfobacteriota bacterium]
MLTSAGLITEEQLPELLALQRGSGLRLGDYLVAKGIVKEESIIAMLSEQLQIPRYDANAFSVDSHLARDLPQATAAKFKVAPLAKDDFVLKIAMVDPMDIQALDTIEKETNLEVEPYICSQGEYTLLVNGIYGIRSEVGEVLEDIGELELMTEEEKTDSLGSLQDMADAAPVVRLVNSILRQAVTEKASDIHISPEKTRVQLRLRIDGRLHEIPPPPKNTMTGIVSRIKIMANMDIANTMIPQDGRFNIHVENQEISVRVSTLPTIYGENVVMRMLYISAGALPLEKLGLEADDFTKLISIARQPYGMLLSVGPTGSGKSSSLYAILNKVNNPEINIITLEDPVEFRMESVRQVQLNAKAGMTFASGLRSILRQDPNVIMVGEIRDGETANIAVQAALTGHLVLSTLHTNDSTSTITRLQNMGIEAFLLSASLLGVCAQRLMRRICGHCAAPIEPQPELVSFWGLGNHPDPKFMAGGRCSMCNHSGYRGRVGIYELLSVDEEVRQMIVDGLSATEMAVALSRQGKLHLLKDMAAKKIAAGVTTFEEAAETVLA